MPDKITKFINSLNQKTRSLLKKKLLAIKTNPTSSKNVKALKGRWAGCYRLRFGKIRIIYTLRKGSVEIVDIDYRGGIY